MQRSSMPHVLPGWQDRSHMPLRSDGRRLHVRSLIPPQVKDSLPILCLHGLTRNNRDFEPLWPFLAELERPILAVDTRGRGRSDPGADPHAYTLPVYVADLLKAMDDLGVSCADFVGTSMGGMMTMEVARLQPDRIRRAVINDVGPILGAAGLARIFSYALEAPPVMADWQEAADTIRSRAGLEFPGRDNEFWMQFADRTCVRRGSGQILFDYDPAILEPILTPVGVSAPADPWGQFDALAQKPLTVLRGELSALLEPAVAQAMVDKGPDVRLVTIANVGHAPLLNEPEAVSAILERLGSA